jgi:hypothetical protein
MKDIASTAAVQVSPAHWESDNFGKGPGFARQRSSKAMFAGLDHDLCYAFRLIEPGYIASRGLRGRLRGRGLAARGRKNGIERRF